MKRATYDKDTKIDKETTPNKKIILIISKEDYQKVLTDNYLFKKCLLSQYSDYPELFPVSFGADKWSLYGYVPASKKQNIRLRRIKLSDGSIWQVYPSFIMPYMTCSTKDASRYLFLLNWCPYWALTKVFGGNDMFYYRLHRHFGGYNMVGTTVKTAEEIPVDLLADEKHGKISGQKVYLAMTCAKDCFLGASISGTASEEDLTKSYGSFKEEAVSINKDYKPETVNTDGWFATMNAWKNIFPLITILQCFLHAVLKIKNVATKVTEDIYRNIVEQAWNAYKAKNKRSFSQRIRRLNEYAQSLRASKLKTALKKLCSKKDWFIPAYDFGNAHRTSNMIDRLINRTDRRLFIGKWWHGSLSSAEKSIRAFCLIQNFCPYCPRVSEKYYGQESAFERLNGYKYAVNWTENMLIATSGQQRYTFQQKKLE